MRNLISFMVITLDGYTSGPNGEFDWPNVGPEFFEFSNRQNAHIDTLLFGRATYEHMASYWPDATEGGRELIEFMNGVAKVVVSATLDKAEWNNSTLVRGDDLAATVPGLKQRDGKEIALFGSPRLTTSLLELGLIDELRVMVNPILLGGGQSLFGTLQRRVPLALRRTTTFASGNVELIYRPA